LYPSLALIANLFTTCLEVANSPNSLYLGARAAGCILRHEGRTGTPLMGVPLGQIPGLSATHL